MIKLYTIHFFQKSNNTSFYYSFEYRDFQFSYPSSLLSKAQRQFYDDNGFLLIRSLIPNELLDVCMYVTAVQNIIRSINKIFMIIYKIIILVNDLLIYAMAKCLEEI